MTEFFNYNAAFRGAWRRVFARSPVVKEVLNEARRTAPRFKQDGTRHKVDRVEFQCEVCQNWELRKNIEVDHIIPVIDEHEGFEDWDTFFERLVGPNGIPNKDNLQRICDTCHDKKTAEERRKRTIAKDTVALDAILAEILKPLDLPLDVKAVKKELSKYTKKGKPDEIRNRAITIKDIFFVKFKLK